MRYQECVKTTSMLYADLPYFLSARTLVQPSRLQKLLPLWGARRDVMNGHWCDQAEITESIAARGGGGGGGGGEGML